MIANALNDKPLPVYGEGLNVRDWLYVEDHCKAIDLIIHEGKNRQVRRMCAFCGMTVRRLKRIREGKLYLDKTLRPGQWRNLTQEELDTLL